MNKSNKSNKYYVLGLLHEIISIFLATSQQIQEIDEGMDDDLVYPFIKLHEDIKKYAKLNGII